MSLQQIDVFAWVENLDPYLLPLEEEALSLSWHLIDNDTRVHIQAIFEAEKNLLSLSQQLSLAAQLLQDESMEVKIHSVPVVNWLEAYAQTTPPLRVGRFFIYGSHLKNTSKPRNTLPLWIDAATAFGSGEHATTSGCLLALLDLKKRKNFRRILDMGCGTGILGIAAAKLWPVTPEGPGRRIVVAGDIDPEAVRITRINAFRNQVTLVATVCKGFRQEKIHKFAPYDLIIANILAKPLCFMARDLGSHLAPDGYVILSGLLTVQERMVLSAYALQGIYLSSRYKIGEWSTLILKKGEKK